MLILKRLIFKTNKWINFQNDGFDNKLYFLIQKKIQKNFMKQCLNGIVLNLNVLFKISNNL